MNLVLGLLVLGGATTAVWAGIADPEGGVWAGLRNAITGIPNTKHDATATAAAFISTIVPTSSGSSGGATAAGDPAAVAPITPAPVAGGGTRATIVNTARGWLGVPYRWAGTTRAGVDCSGLVQAVYKANGITLPRTAALQQTRGFGEAANFAQAGDLVFFGAPAHHVGIYLGGGLMLHAPHTGTVVRVEAVASVAGSLPGSPVTYRDVIDR